MRVLSWLAAAYCLYAVLALVLQRTMLFPGTQRSAIPNPPVARHGGEVIWLAVAAGKVEAWFLPARSVQGPAPAMLFAHGNYELIDDWPESLGPLRDRGVSLMLVEYPGYGRSAGSPTEESVRAVMEAAFDALAARPEVDANRIVAYGRSLGGGAVCTLMPGRRPAALILQSTFSSLGPFAHSMGLPAWLLRDRFDNRRSVRGYDGPILSVHGLRDDVIPYAHAERLRAASERVEVLDYPCAHNDCPPDFAKFFDQVIVFLRGSGVL